LVLAAVVLVIIGGAKANKTYDIPVESVAIPTGSEAIQRGEHIATVSCKRCHLDSLAGEVYFAAPGMLTIPTPNLTSGKGGVGGVYTAEDFVRAIRHGVARDQRGLMIMPANSFYYMSDEDLGALIAYLRSVPPVDNQLAERKIEPLGLILFGAGMIPAPVASTIDHTGPRPVAPQPGVTAEYGQYLAHRSFCTECHGPTLNGAPFGPPGQEVATPNLTRGGELIGWSEADFINTLRTGVTPGGHKLSDDMPWKYLGKMTDDELKALWMYLQSLPALDQGGL
jgi:mono/diheme cytochrome c family protein